MSKIKYRTAIGEQWQELTVIMGPQGPTGEKGEDGYTPVRGIDYWTEADQQAIIEAVLASLRKGEAVAQ